jgi:hypothetical protein
MKTTLTLLTALMACIPFLLAQAPNAISYQAAARDGNGNLLSNSNLQVRFSINQGSAGGTTMYQETHSVTTNDYGLFTAAIGSGTVVSGTFANINWATTSHYLRVEVNPGSGYVNLGTTQLVSVPYALNAASSNSPWGLNGSTIRTTAGTNVGINTNNAQHRLEINPGSDTINVGGGLTGNAANAAIGIRSTLDVVGTGPGIAFTASSAGNNRGALITFERTGGNSRGKLHLGAKNSTGVSSEVPLQLTLSDNDMVGIRYSSPTTTLTIRQNPFTTFTEPGEAGLTFLNHLNTTSPWTIYNSNNFLSFAFSNARLAYVHSSTGAWTLSSDARLKTGVTDMDGVLAKLVQLRPVKYSYIGREGGETIGFLAQDVAPLFPEVVSKDDETVEAYYGISYGTMSVIAIKAIQEQQAIIEQLESKLKILEDRLNALEGSK